MKQLCPTVLLAASLVVPLSGAYAAATPLDDGYAAEAWERTGLSPCKGGSSIRKLAGGDYVHIFKDPTGTFRAPADHAVEISYLVIGAGGAGGDCDGGGGGAGGVKFGKLQVAAGGVVNITLGRGGYSAKLGTLPDAVFETAFLIEGIATTDGNSTGNNSNGGNTFLNYNGSVITGVGGGYGGNHNLAGSTPDGAGAGGHGNATVNDPAYGGAGYPNYTETAAPSGTTAGSGGDGCATYIAGELMTFAAGGGGGGRLSSHSGGKGGIGGGGDGAGYVSDGNKYINGHCALANSGSGGGGGCSNGGNNHTRGGSGGSGIVIIRYSGAGLTPVVNGCIDRTVEGEVTIGSYAPANGPGILVEEGAAQGGEIHQLSNGEFVHRFTQSGTFTAPANTDIEVDYLVIGGGGAGGGGDDGYYGGGGGAGGVCYGRVTIPRGTVASVTVGHGGAATSRSGNNGEDSVVSFAGDEIRSFGGGGGGDVRGGANGAAGGSGGGPVGASKDYEQGTDGGYATSAKNAGGGGAGRNGGVSYTDAGNRKHAGNGGDGVGCAITGEANWYAGGGGGNWQSYYGGLGGKGGGANGACYDTRGVNQSATVALANTGSGGGGGNNWESNNKGYASSGADGVVILRYMAYHVSTGWEVLGGMLMWTATCNATPTTTIRQLYYAKSAAELDNLASLTPLEGSLVEWVDAPGSYFVRWNLSDLDRSTTYYFKAVMGDGSETMESSIASSTMPGYAAYSMGDGGTLTMIDAGSGIPDILHSFPLGDSSFTAPMTLAGQTVSIRYLAVGGGAAGRQGSAGNPSTAGAGGDGGAVEKGTMSDIAGGLTGSVHVGFGGQTASGYSATGGAGDDSFLSLGSYDLSAAGGAATTAANRGGSGAGSAYSGYNGGAGVFDDITGEMLVYSGGGGGGSVNSGTIYPGGGAGGNGASNGRDATAGADGFGGGGGGGNNTYAHYAANGGSGCVYVRYSPQPYDTTRPFGELREVVVQEDGLVRLETYLYFLGDGATSATAVLLWGGEGEELMNEIALDENMVVTSASRVFYLDALPFGTNLNFAVRFTNNDGVNEGKYSSTQQHPLAVPPLTLFEPVEPVVNATNLTVAFTGEVAVVGYGSTTIQVRYGPERDMLIHTNKPVDQISYEMYGDEGPYSFATMDIRCDRKGDKMPTVYYVYDLLETAGSTNRVLRSWTSEILKVKVYTPQGTTFGIR